MLTIMVELQEGFDQNTQEFVAAKEYELHLEHSLVSLSKWESQWEKPFLGLDKKSTDETLSYVRCMALNEDVPPEVWTKLSVSNVKEINVYIDSKQTATTFNDVSERKGGREIITAEIVYYWMIALTIPFECQHWHLNRLLTLVRVCNLKNAPAKTMGRREAVDMQRRLNAERKARLNTTG